MTLSLSNLVIDVFFNLAQPVEDKTSFTPLIIGSAISLVTILSSTWYSVNQLRQNRRKVIEDINVELIKQRRQPYTKLMTDLVVLSSQETENNTDNQLRERVKKTITIIQNNIFGEVGIISSYETREMILRLRAKCIFYLLDKVDFKSVHTAAMEVHQMLRSDLGVPQPGLLNIIEKARNGKIEDSEEKIEELARNMKHITWTKK